MYFYFAYNNKKMHFQNLISLYNEPLFIQYCMCIEKYIQYLNILDNIVKQYA